MNAAGQVIGVSDVLDSNGIYRGQGVFLWANGTMTNLDTFENGRYDDYASGSSYCSGSNFVYNVCPAAVRDVAVDINDSGQVLFIRQNNASPLVPTPPPPGPVVWSNGVITPLPQTVSFGVGKSINNRGDVLGYTGDTSISVWNVNTGATYQFDTGYSVGAGSVGWAKLTNQGEVYFPRADGIYKLTPDHIVQQVMSYTCWTVNQIEAVNDQGQVAACGYINYHGVATPLSSLVPDPSSALDNVLAINNAGQILTHKALLTPIQNIASCDANQDGKINTTDLSIMYAANNTANPAYDMDGDGKVTVRDIRICVLQCNNASCQP